jgi:2-polyprenyl-3-methyl-5-hydroxy-6-metoxy-1,4-benzoquinol methylase
MTENRSYLIDPMPLERNADSNRQTASPRLSPAEAEQQRRADQYFSAEAAYWDAIYSDQDIMSTIYQLRRVVVLDMVDRLLLPREARILEVGCGAGLTSVELARRGYTVDAIDTVEEMLVAARHHAADNTFDLVIAMGVIPWLHSPREAIKEMRRVAKDRGCLIVTSDNKWRLNHVLDPRLTPLLNPLKTVLKSMIRPWRTVPPAARVYMYSPSQMDKMVKEANLTMLHCVTLGFGPFSFLGRSLFSDPIGVRFHRLLQDLADRRIPGIRSAGSHNVMLARKDDPR